VRLRSGRRDPPLLEVAKALMDRSCGKEAVSLGREDKGPINSNDSNLPVRSRLIVISTSIGTIFSVYAAPCCHDRRDEMPTAQPE
jgi:hypothetical protein